MPYASQLAEAIGASAQTLRVIDEPDVWEYPYLVRIDDEVVSVTGGIGQETWLVDRGALGSTPAQHAAGSPVVQAFLNVGDAPGPATGGGSHPGAAAHEALGLAPVAHGHDQTAITGLVATLDGKAANGHDHDGLYAPTSHAHVDADLPLELARDFEIVAAIDAHAATPHGGSHPDLAAHDAIGLATDADVTAHAQAADPHPGYLTASEGNAAYSAVGHGHTLDFGEVGDIVASTFGDTAAAGSTGEVADAGHRHAREVNPVTAHEAGANPHPVYLTQTEADALYQPTDADLSAIAGLSTTAFGRALLALADAAALAGSHSHGGGAGAWTVVVKTADESKNNSASVADDQHLQVTLLANTQYTIRLRAFFLTNATADLKYRLVFTGTTTRVRRRVSRTATTDIAVTTELKTAFDAADVILTTTGLNPWLEEHIILQVGAAGGVLKLQWGQVTSNAGPTTCLEGSYLEVANA